MEPDETPERPGVYTQAVMTQLEREMLSETSQPFTPFERRIIFNVVRIVESDMY